MLDKLIPSFYGGGDGGNNLGSGGNPGMLQGEDKNALSNYASVPGQVTQLEVDKVARDAGQLEGNTAMMRVWSEQALLAQSAALANLDVRINHAQRSMGNESQYRKKIAKHGKNVLEHNIDTRATQVNLDGFQGALSNATETIHI